MSESLRGFLEEVSADSDTIQQSARYYLADITNDLSPEQMLQELTDVIGDSETVNKLLRDLEADSLSIENAALVLLSSGWSDNDETEHIKEIVNDAKEKLPVIEIGIIAIVGMYGLYLIASGNRKSTGHTVIRKPNGEFEERTTTDYYSFSSPLKAVVDIVVKGVNRNSE